MTSAPPPVLDPSTRSALPKGRPHPAAANGIAAAGVLSACAGFLDGFAYLGHGHIFASAMTGNMVLLGITLAQSLPKALAYALPLLAYAVGVITVSLLEHPRARRWLPGSLHFMTLVIEIAVLTVIPFLPGNLDDRTLVSLITASTAMQNTSFRNIGTRTYNSTIMTGNLQNFSNALTRSAWAANAAARAQLRDLGFTLTSFICGAVLGAYVTPRFGNFSTLVPALLLLALAAALSRAPAVPAAGRATSSSS
jgi:uncharacterized membrane protein YoaK (UPF0700 family)